MHNAEHDEVPETFEFDVAIVAVGYERRARWVTESSDVQAELCIGLEFGFLKEASFEYNKDFFVGRNYRIINGLDGKAQEYIGNAIKNVGSDSVSVFVDVSSMSREMIANVIIGLERARHQKTVRVVCAYAPSKFSGGYGPAPIRLASPIKPSLAGWSSQPERPLGAIFGLGCEPGLALGALQFLEPSKAWTFKPEGFDPQFADALEGSNRHLNDIFDVTGFTYKIDQPTITRGRFEALLNAVGEAFRVVAVPFGPKIFAWLVLSTVAFTNRTQVGVWAFSSKEQAMPVDREAEGPIIWHTNTAIREEAPRCITLDGNS